MVIDGSHTASGKPMIASDPHLGLRLPNLWLLAGVKSPSMQVVGMMPAGLPIFGLGRNPEAAWGGTNLRGASSDLIDIEAVGYSEADLVTETRPLKVRWWPDTQSEVQISPVGPVISDAPLLGLDRDQLLAIRWVGHDTTDEITAFLHAARATSWQNFAVNTSPKGARFTSRVALSIGPGMTKKVTSATQLKSLRATSDSSAIATATTLACLKVDKEADTKVVTAVDRATKADKVVATVADKVADTSSPRTKATVADKTLSLTL